MVSAVVELEELNAVAPWAIEPRESVVVMRHLTGSLYLHDIVWVNVGQSLTEVVVALFQHMESTLARGHRVVTHPPIFEEIMWLEIVVMALDYRQLSAEEIGDLASLAENPRDYYRCVNSFL